jgi:hypothetical protein
VREESGHSQPTGAAQDAQRAVMHRKVGQREHEDRLANVDL